MKRTTRSLLVSTGLCILLVVTVSPGYGQNVVENGSFENTTGWTIYNGGTPDEVEFLFPYTGERPTWGSGDACLYIYGLLQSGEWINGLIWQQVELEGGKTYVCDAAWTGLYGDFDQGSWFQIYVSEEEPVDGSDWTPIGDTHSDRMLGFNSWSGCPGLAVDGTFMDDACDPNHTVLYRAPAKAGETVPVFIGLKTGAGWGGTEFEILVDDISLRPNLITNGDFENDESWSVYDLGAPQSLEVILSDSTENAPALGHNNCMIIKGDAQGESCNGLIWQKLELIGGATYEFNGGFRHVSGNLADGFWCQVYLSEEAPIEGQDWTPTGETNSDLLIGFNSTTDCSGDLVDGTFRKFACDGQDTTQYIAPGTSGEPVDVYFGIKAGSNSSEPFEITIDDISLVQMSDTETAVKNVSHIKPSGYTLEQNVPNPFNPGTGIRYSIPVQTRVHLAVYNVLGHKVATLVDENQAPGTYSVTFDASKHNSGLYLYRLETDDFSETKRMLFIK